MSKITVLDPVKGLHWRTLLAQIADEPGTDAVVCVVRINGAWTTCWSSGEKAPLDLGGISMATLKLTCDVTSFIHTLDSNAQGLTHTETTKS